MPAFVRKSLETDKKRKALEAQTPENWKSRHCSNPSNAPPPSIQSRPALRAPRLDPRVSPRAAPHPKAGEREKRERHPMPKSLKARTDELTDSTWAVRADGRGDRDCERKQTKLIS